MKPLRVAVIGMGGYAGRHHQTVHALEAAGVCRLVATCDPAAGELMDRAIAWRLEQRGVSVHTDYREMLASHASGLDLAIIPTPIPLHAEMHAAAVEAGLAVYLEKPPTLDPAELEQMIERDRGARVPTLVGFNFIAEPVRQSLKRRLLDGEFGALRSVRLLGLWGRSASYYGRAEWAGRLVGDDGRLILDSCLGNALSHHVHNTLHWAGTAGLDSWAAPARVRCELLRAHPIEGPDSVFLSAETDSGVPLRIAMSHACHGPEVHREQIFCDLAEIDYVTGSRAVIRWRNGPDEQIALPPFDPQAENLLALAGCLRGERAKPPTTLADSRPFVHLHALAFVSAGRIEPWPEEQVLRESDGVAPGFRQVDGLAGIAEGFLRGGRWPRVRPREATPADLAELDPVVRGMVEAAAVCP